MSTKLTTWVWHGEETAELRGNTFVALLALADIANDDGHVIYAKGSKRTQESLARKSRMSVATFRRATVELVGMGLLEVTRESQRTENEYRVLMSAQSERSGLSGHAVESERSERSPGERSSAATPLIGRSDVLDITPVVPRGDATEEAFDRIWEMWPTHRRGTRKKSGSSFRTAVRAVGGVRNVSTILDAARAHADVWLTWPESDMQFVPSMTTWLNQERWSMPAPTPRSGKLSTVEAGRAAAEILKAREGAGRLAVSA